MKLIFLFCLVCLGLSGCNPSEDFLDSLFGIKHNVVVLAPNALEISPAEIAFSPLDAAEVVGKMSSVCVVLAGGISGKRSESEAHRLLGDAKLHAVVVTNDGVAHDFKCQGTGWALSGKIVDSNEVTACAQPSCGEQAIPVGSKIRAIRVSSTKPIHTLGAYWQSTAAFDRNDNPGHSD